MTVTLAVPVTNNTPTGYIAQPVIANAIAIRDTSAHDPSTDATLLLADLRALPGSRVLYVNNTLNQSVTITLEASTDGTTLKTIGSGVTVTAGTTRYIDASDITQLSNPYPYIAIQAQCGSSPASGSLTVQLLAASIAGGAGSSGGGGGGAVTAADGALATIGTTTDVAWSSGAGTEIALQKTIAGNTAGLATQTTLAAAKVDLDTIAGIVSSSKAATKASAGDIADLAHGQGTMANSVPVALASNQSAIPVTASAGTNLNTSALALETGGNLATLAGVVSASKAAVKSAAGDVADLAHGQATMVNSVPVVIASNQTAVANNITQVAGATLSGTNPLITEAMVQNLIRNAQGYQATTGRLVTATNANLQMGMSLFNPIGSGKSIMITSAKATCQNASAVTVQNTTTDPAYATTITATNLKLGGTASVLTSSLTSAASGATAGIATSGSVYDATYVAATSFVELLANGNVIILPAGAANGISMFVTVTTAGNAWSFTFRWIEF